MAREPQGAPVGQTSPLPEHASSFASVLDGKAVASRSATRSGTSAHSGAHRADRTVQREADSSVAASLNAGIPAAQPQTATWSVGSSSSSSHADEAQSAAASTPADPKTAAQSASFSAGQDLVAIRSQPATGTPIPLAPAGSSPGAETISDDSSAVPKRGDTSPADSAPETNPAGAPSQAAAALDEPTPTIGPWSTLPTEPPSAGSVVPDLSQSARVQSESDGAAITPAQTSARSARIRSMTRTASAATVKNMAEATRSMSTLGSPADQTGTVTASADVSARDLNKGETTAFGKRPTRLSRSELDESGGASGAATDVPGHQPVLAVPNVTLTHLSGDASGASATPPAMPASPIPAQATTASAQGSPSDAAALPSTAATPAETVVPLGKIEVARLVRSVAGSELRVGVRSAEFGQVNIRAALGRDQISAHVVTESERLGSALSAHLASMPSSAEDRPGTGVALKTTVSVTSDTSSGSDSNSARQRGQSWPQPNAGSDTGANTPSRISGYAPYSASSAGADAASTASSIRLSALPTDRLSIRI